MPVASMERMASSAGRLKPHQLITRLAPAAATATVPATAEPLILVPDAEPYPPELLEALAALPRPVWRLALPPGKQLSELRSVGALAALLAAAIKSTLPTGPYLLAGAGVGGVVAHEVAAQLQAAGEQVPALLLLDPTPLREAADMADQPWFRLHHFLGAWRPDVDLEALEADAKLLAAQPHGWERQLDAAAALRPPSMLAATWELAVEERCVAACLDCRRGWCVWGVCVQWVGGGVDGGHVVYIG